MRSVRVINRPKRLFLSFFSFISLFSLILSDCSLFSHLQPLLQRSSPPVDISVPTWWPGSHSGGAAAPELQNPFFNFILLSLLIYSPGSESHIKKRNTRPRSRNKKKSYHFLVIWFGFVCIGSAGSQYSRFGLI